MSELKKIIILALMTGAAMLVLILLIGLILFAGFLIGRRVERNLAETQYPIVSASVPQRSIIEPGTPEYTVVVVTPTPMPTHTPLPPTPTESPSLGRGEYYPLAGTVYESPEGWQYNARWEADGWLWQPYLPPEGSRVGHSVAITLFPGRYIFNGVSCWLHLDEERNGRGADNPRTVGYGNGLPFKVDTADGGQAWAIVVCDPTAVSGFSIQYEGPLP